MSMSKEILKGVLMLAIVALAVFLTSGGEARAADVQVKLLGPQQLSVGQPTELRVKLTSSDGGQPVAGASLAFYSEVSFFGITREVELGRAITDENGVAILSYMPRSPGQQGIHVKYLSAADGDQTEVATFSIPVVGTGQQLYRSTSGIQIPGLNVWLLIALVSGVWAIIFGVALRVLAIARTDQAAVAHREAAPAPAGISRPGSEVR